VGAGTGFMLEFSKQTPRAVNANAAQEITLPWMSLLQDEMAPLLRSSLALSSS